LLGNPNSIDRSIEINQWGGLVSFVQTQFKASVARACVCVCVDPPSGFVIFFLFMVSYVYVLALRLFCTFFGFCFRTASRFFKLAATTRQADKQMPINQYQSINRSID
jgi:hypothetical protein